MKPAAWSALEDLRAHREALGNLQLRDLFATDPDRFSRFSISLGDLTLDYSKNRIVPETIPLLLALAERADVAALRDKMFSGEAINVTENRAVLHVALRAPPDADIRVGDHNVVPHVPSPTTCAPEKFAASLPTAFPMSSISGSAAPTSAPP
jgi:glucose-6-phosphate isomerase